MKSRTGSRRISAAVQSALALLPLWLIILLCCGLPLAWMTLQIARNPEVLAQLNLDAFRWKLLARTLGYNAAVAVLATVMGLPAAVVLGRRRGLLSSALWVLLPAVLVMPSIAYAYGWTQFFRLTFPLLGPDAVEALGRGGAVDVARCVWTLAAWLWPLPAGVVGLALRRLDVSLQQYALLEGALWRVTARQLAGPVAASVACVTVLASQEFSVYETPGISVVATEVRMVFETGAFSSLANPIDQPMGDGGGALPEGEAPAERGSAAPEEPVKSGEPLGVPSAARRESRPPQDASPYRTPDQNALAAAAVATSLPLLGVTALLCGVAAWGVRSLSAAEELDAGPWPRALDAGRVPVVLAGLVLFVTLVVPVACMALSLKRPFDPPQVWRVFGPQVNGSLLLGSVAGGLALLLAAGAAAAGRRVAGRAALVIALITFLIGGQLLAIALIRLYNRPAPWPLDSVLRYGRGGRRDVFDLLYPGAPVAVMAYLARFGWLALLAGGATWSRPWRHVRDMAAVDGAGPWRTFASVVWPLAWPVLAASALLVAVLSLTEVPATVLLKPMRPQPLVPTLMTWVHMLRYDDMLEGSLLLMSIAFLLAVVAALMVWAGVRLWNRGWRMEDRGSRMEDRGSQRLSAGRLLAILYPLSAILILSAAAGCDDDANEPDAVWLETGAGPGQVVYPRCIDYSPADDSFFVVDRMARVLHLDRNGKQINSWQMPEAVIGKPVGVSVGPDGNVYVPDTHYQRVMVYSPKGEFVRRWGSQGKGPGQFIFPTDVAFDSKGRVFVSEYGDNDRIQVFDGGGKFLYAFGSFGQGDGQFSRPQSMLMGNENGEEVVYVTDSCNHRIAVFKTDGSFVRNMGQTGSALGQFRYPYGLARGGDGNLIVCEFGNNRVQKVDRLTGKGLAVWGGPGRELGRMAYPWAVAVDRKDRIVAVDSGNNRLQVFEF